jgi:hypothetical protein
MAKFFKNYNQITYKILEEVTNNISQDELKDIEIDPKYLRMAIIGTYYGIHIRKPLKSLMNH